MVVQILVHFLQSILNPAVDEDEMWRTFTTCHPYHEYSEVELAEIDRLKEQLI